MGRKKATPMPSGKKMKQMLLSPNLTLTKGNSPKKKSSPNTSPTKNKQTKKKNVSPQKSPKGGRRPKPQSKASAKLKNNLENKENANDVVNNNIEKDSPSRSLQNNKKSPEKEKSPSKKNENSPTNNNSKSTPSKMSPRKDSPLFNKSPVPVLDLAQGILPLPDRPSSPKKAQGDRSGSSSPFKEGENSHIGFKCKACPQWFPNRYFQRKHMLIAHEDQLYECRVCSFTSVDPEKLKSHIIKLHVSKKEKSDAISQESLQGELDRLIDKKIPRKVMMEDGVALGRDVNSKMRYVCALCHRVYTSKYSLERHVRCHTLEKPYQCDVCNFSSSYREHMMRHMTSVHLIVHSDAPKVKYVAKKKREMNESNNTEPNDATIEPYDVDSELILGLEDQSISSYNEDGSSSIGSSPGKKRRNILRERFECAVCGLRATHKTDLMDHIRTKHPNAHIESLVNNDGSKVHLIVTNAKKIKLSKRLTIQCTYCSLIFHDTWKYKVHLRSHTGVKPFECSICNMRATSKMTIRDHIHRKHKQTDSAKIILRTVGIDGNVEKVELPVPWREFKCDVCQEICEDKYSLKLHKTKKHPDIQPFSCLACDHKEKVKASMIIHCTEVHPNQMLDELVLQNGKPVKIGTYKIPTCDFCAKTFSYKSQLNIHYRLHTGEKELSCTHCEYQTNSKVIMSQHILRTHFGHNISNSGKRRKRSKSKIISETTEEPPKKRSKTTKNAQVETDIVHIYN